MQANGAMLRIARQNKGFLQIDAGRRLDIDQSLLSRIENGMVEAREDFLARAAQVYEVPRSFFYLTDTIYGAPVSVHPMWRKKADVSARELDAVVAELNIRAMHVRRLLEAVEFAHTSELPRMDVDDYGDPDRIASLLRAHWKMPSGPVANLTDLVESSGILVAHSTLGGASISGVTFAPPGLPPLIVLNQDQPADRMRFTLAHELGHLVMHRFPSPDMENEANQFASAFLMPERDIRPYFRGRKIDLALLASLKPEWKVAMQAILMRASSLKELSPNQSQYLWKQISARKLRLREPPELDFPREMPTVLNRIFDMHSTGLNYSDEELANLLHVWQSHLDRYFGRQTKPDGRPRLSVLK
ncbi:ImmA/IrrE family metallo-endopeptidase [Phyllobacterium sp. 628]|uniref:XRE family transcriptional regulator n=1 Tax=Phyllobacterium sp. 628 TaxID=2718938 RepID=UPI0016623148|nr:XRE family transcriptional regulator [Phyllobacterium sp. 628]QND51690.1 ImmA/IrrE family metallo-endopeptidase [Phyllobacterium sp. 628]